MVRSDVCIYLGRWAIGRFANCWVPRTASTVRVMQARFATVRGGLMWMRQGGKVGKRRARGREKRAANCKIEKGENLLVPTIPMYYPRSSSSKDCHRDPKIRAFLHDEKLQWTAYIH